MASIDQLRKALASNLGKTLTPEVAVSIEMAARQIPDNRLNLEQFETKTYRGISFGAEYLADIIEEIHPLHEAHFQETEKHRLGFGLKMNYDYMTAAEMAGTMVQFTARTESGRLVGNIRMYIGESLHTGTLYASEDTFFMLPEYRKGFTSLRFWQYMEDCMKQIGVREIRTDSKVVNKVHKLNEYCGYTHVANKYVKVFKE